MATIKRFEDLDIWQIARELNIKILPLLDKLNESRNYELKSQLENYNNSRKSYYEKNKDIVNEKSKQRLKKIAQEDPEKLREINRQAYLKRKRIVYF